MGIMSNKVTRRVAIGSIAGGLAGVVAVLSGLRGRYKATMPEGAPVRTVGGKTVLDFNGKKVTVDIPPMEIRTPEDLKKYQAIMLEQMRKNPQVIEEIERLKKNPEEIEQLRKNPEVIAQGEKWKEEEKKRQLAIIDRREKEMLDECAKSRWTEQEKQEIAKKTRELVKTWRTKIVENISKLH